MSEPQKLRMSEKLSYGCGDFASCLFWAAFSNFLPLFYTDVFGITAAAMGMLFAVTRIFDAIVDPIVGMLADRTETRWGKFRPYLLWFCVPYAVLGVLMFTTPNFSPLGKLVWAYCTYCGMMAVYTAINIPYTSLLGVTTADPVERTKLSSMKFVFAFAAGFVIKAALPKMVPYFGGTDTAHGWQVSFMIVAAVAVVFFLITFFGTKERVKPPLEQKTSVGRDLKDLVTNVPWLVLVLTTITFILFVAIRGAITGHYLKYYVGARELTLPWNSVPKLYSFEDIWSVFGPAGDAGSIVGVLLLGWFAGKVGKKASFVLLFLAAIASTAAFYWLRADQVYAMFGLQFFGSMVGGPLSVLLWAMYADTADYGEWKAGRRATGLIFSASTMMQKLGWAVGGWAVGQMLATSGFVPNMVQSVGVTTSLVKMMSLTPSLFGLAALGLFLFFPLNEKRMVEIAKDLKDRRANEPVQ